MKTYLLNDGNPLPAGHPKAGKFAMAIEREGAGIQRVYADSIIDLTLKVGAMYGNTQERIAEVKSERDTLRTTAAPRPQAPQPPPPPPASTLTREEQIMQATRDLEDPAKAAEAVVTLARLGAGVDLHEQARRDRESRAADDVRETERRNAEAVNEFIRRNPDFVPGPGGRLIRDRAFANAGVITVDSLEDAFEELKAEGLLDSEPLQPATEPQGEPSAPPAPRPRGTATSVRPSSLGSQSRQAPKPKLTYQQIMDMSATPEYERRLRNEPGFAEEVNRAVAEFERRAG